MAKGRLNEELTEAQREIMELVWQHSELSVLAVLELISKRRTVAKTTVRTLMERMERKGWLKHREQGRTFIYRAARPKQKTIANAVSEVVQRLCDNRPELLVTALLEDRDLSDEELDRIRKLLNREKARRHSQSEK